MGQYRPHRSPTRYPLLKNGLGDQLGGGLGQRDELHPSGMVVNKYKYVGVPSGHGSEWAEDVCCHDLERRADR